MREIPRDLTDAEQELYLAVTRGDLLETASILRQAREPLPQDLAAACLTKGLYACPELFGKLLEWCPEREYAGKVLVTSWPWRSAADATDWQLQGTLVTLAAALNKAEHLKLLLERGMDANSASLAAGAALLTLEESRGCGYGERHGFPFPGRNGGLDNKLEVGTALLNGEFDQDLMICGMTPLAAAVTFGAVECVELLLEQPDLWLTESLSVSAALLLPFRDWSDRYNQACSLVRTRYLEHGQARKLILWAAAKSCTTRQLREELARHAYTEAELALAALCVSLEQYGGIFGKKGVCDPIGRMWGKLTLLEQRCPSAVHTPEVSRNLLGVLFTCNQEDQREELLPLAVRAAQGTADISLAGNALESTKQAWLASILQAVCKNGRCVLERDAVPFALNKRNLRLLLKYAEILPPRCRGGISGLTCAILFSGDLRLIQKALDRGLIPGEETTEQLLRFQKKLSINPAVRTLLLCARREEAGAPELPGLPQMVRRWMGRYRWFAEDELSGTTEELWQEWLLSPDCSERLERYYVLLDRVSCGVHLETLPLPLAGTEEPVLFESDSRPIAMCLLGKTATALAAYQGVIGHVDVDTVWIQPTEGNTVFLVLTPLCAAALAGQTDLVRKLLEQGLDAEEYDRSRPCWVKCDGEAMPLTPLVAALLGGHWDTVRLLTEWGAACDLRDPCVEKLRSVWWTKITEEDVREQLPDLLLPGGRLDGRTSEEKGA